MPRREAGLREFKMVPHPCIGSSDNKLFSMKRYAVKLHVLSLALVLPSATAFAASPESFDWPQWRGPDRNAVSKERGLLREWPKEGPPLAWKNKGLGGGYSGPSIAAGKIFGMSYRGDDEVVWALSEQDGKEHWATRLGPAYRQPGWPQGKEGPACTPTVDGERLYVIGMAGDLACLQVGDGKIIWRSSLTRDFGGRIPQWSYRESPLIDGDKLICTPGGPRRDPSGPRQDDRQDNLEEPGARQSRGGLFVGHRDRF